jgi:transcriptional regulator with PAS, ATPase and Fis domain
VFLDEIGDLPIQMQPKLLRVIEDKEFERIGGTSVIRSDFRLIAATNQNLEEMLTERRFRKDLFYRLNVIPLHIPPLRERPDDILPLVRHFLDQTAQEAFLPEITLDRAAEEVLRSYPWPGNIRELSNVLERVLSSLEGNTVHLSDLPFYLYRSQKIASKLSPVPIREVQFRAEKEAILHTLRLAEFNKSKAAEMLGIHRTHLYKKIKKYGITRPSQEDMEE